MILLLLGTNAATGAQDTWTEVVSPHFTVVSDGGERTASRVAQEFEKIRAVVQAYTPKADLEPNEPILILAAKNEGSLRYLVPGYWQEKDGVRPVGVFRVARSTY